MADPTTPDADTLMATGQAATFAKNAMEDYSNSLHGIHDLLDRFSAKAFQVKNSLDATQTTTEQQTVAFGLLATEVLGTRKAFDNLGAGIDTLSLNTFTDQITDLSNTLKESPMAAQVEGFVGALLKMGAPTRDVTEAAKGGIGVLKSYAASFAESADNGLRLQNAYIQLSAAAGNLNEIYTAAGPNFNKINLLLSQQQDLVTGSAKATGVSTKVIEQYYSQLGTVPKALSSNVSLTADNTQKTNMLTAAIRVATGAGRPMAEVIDNIRVAFRDYNISGEEALRFTLRMTEISNKFGIEQSEVQSALRSTADEFKIFGNEAEGAANIYNQYLGALQSTGISGSVAIDVVKGMVNGIEKLGIAQKSFLSAQTGGPGGLMGAFQIEKELREGKIDKVFDKVRQSLGKQFGSIVTLEEASQSQAAAAQLTKQIQILRQGALGSFAKDDQSAIRILEAFRARDQGKITSADLSKNIVQDTAKAGLAIEEKSYTELTKISSDIAAIRGATSISNLKVAQNAFTVGQGTQNVPSAAASAFRENLTQDIQQAARETATTATEFSNDLINKNVKDRSGKFAYKTIDNISKFYEELGPAIQAPFAEISQLLKSGDQAGVARTIADFHARINEEKEAAQTLNKAAKEQALNRINQEQEQADNAFALLNRKIGAGSNVENAARNASNNITETANNVVKANYQETPKANVAGNLGDITVHVEGYCINCGVKMRNTAQNHAVNVAQRVEK